MRSQLLSNFVSSCHTLMHERLELCLPFRHVRAQTTFFRGALLHIIDEIIAFIISTLELSYRRPHI